MIGRFNSLLCFERFDDPFSMLATGLRQKLTKQRFKVFWLTLYADHVDCNDGPCGVWLWWWVVGGVETYF